VFDLRGEGWGFNSPLVQGEHLTGDKEYWSGGRLR